jgi:2-iminobutanoate/2-iminopropanoate deaminase
MDRQQPRNAGTSQQIGHYSDAIPIPVGCEKIIVVPTPGLDENDNIPADFADEARQAWWNVATILAKLGASLSDIVSVRQFLTRPEDIETYMAVRIEMITHEPTFMLLLISELVRPEMHIGIEAVAIVPSDR